MFVYSASRPVALGQLRAEFSKRRSCCPNVVEQGHLGRSVVRLTTREAAGSTVTVFLLYYSVYV